MIINNTSNNDEKNPDIPENIFEGDVILFNQESVFDFAIENYTEINGDLTIGSSYGTLIKDLTPLTSLKTITGALTIQYNYAITNLDGLINVNKIGNIVNILHNPSLNDLCGLSNIPPAVKINILNNAYNPSQSDINSANCKN
jgi:hypothetical protein